MKKFLSKINKKTALIIGVGLIFVLALLIFVCENFVPYSIGEPSVIPSITLSQHDFGISKNRLLLLNTEGVQAYDRSGEYRWDMAIKTASPYLVTAGGKYAIADLENTTVWNMKNDKTIYSIESENSVDGIFLNSNGYLGILSSEHGYRSILTVYDDFGNETFKWFSGEGYITCAAISSNNKNAVSASLCEGETDVSSAICFFDMTKTTPLNKVILKNEVAYKLLYDGGTVYLLTDKGVYSYNKKGEFKSSYSFSGKILQSFSFDSAENIAISLNRTDEYGSMLSGSKVIFLNKRLTEKESADVNFEVSAMDVKDGFCIVSGLRNVALIKTNGKIKAEALLKTDCDRVKLFNNAKSFATLSGNNASIYSINFGG